MTQLPDDANATTSYMSNASRTEAEMKVALEQLHEVIAEIGSKPPQTLTIATGALGAPLSSMVLVDPEGSGVDDVLNTMAVTNLTQGRIVILRNASTASSETTNSGKVTINSGTSAAAIELSGGGTFVLCAERHLGLIYDGTHWVEIWRSYGRKNALDSVAERDDLGLGDAAVENIASSAGGSASKVLKTGTSALSADDILKIDSTGKIVAATASDLGGADADTVDGLHATSFVRSDSTSSQQIAASLLSSSAGATRFISNTTGAGQSAGLSLGYSGTERALLSMAESTGIAELKTVDAGGTQTPSIRLNPSNDRLEFNTGTASWESLRPGAGNGLDADTLDGVHLSTISTRLDTSGTKRWSFTGGATEAEINATNNNYTERDILRLNVPSSVQSLADTGDPFGVTLNIIFSTTNSTSLKFVLYFGTGLVGSEDVPATSVLEYTWTPTPGSTGNYDSTGGRKYSWFSTALSYPAVLPSGFDSFVLRGGETSNTSGNHNLNIYTTAQAGHSDKGAVPSGIVSSFVFSGQEELT